MIIGILSDTHGDVKRTVRAIEAIKTASPAHIVHCGDIGSLAVLTELADGFMKPEVMVTCVLGNVDGWDDDLISAWPHVEIVGRFGKLTLHGKNIAIVHGDDFRRLRGAIESGENDYVFTGHTHERSDDREGKTRIINPGALHRTREPGCAVLNLATDKLAYIDVI
jgi:uncharacterized protein